MSAIQYWNTLSFEDKCKLVSRLAVVAKQTNDIKLATQVMKVNFNDNQEFMSLFTKALNIAVSK